MKKTFIEWLNRHPHLEHTGPASSPYDSHSSLTWCQDGENKSINWDRFRVQNPEVDQPITEADFERLADVGGFEFDSVESGFPVLEFATEGKSGGSDES